MVLSWVSNSESWCLGRNCACQENIWLSLCDLKLKFTIRSSSMTLYDQFQSNLLMWLYPNWVAQNSSTVTHLKLLQTRLGSCYCQSWHNLIYAINLLHRFGFVFLLLSERTESYWLYLLKVVWCETLHTFLNSVLI